MISKFTFSVVQAFQRRTFLLKVFQAVVFIHAVRLEEPRHLHASQPEHLAELGLGNAAGSQFFKRESLERSA